MLHLLHLVKTFITQDSWRIEELSTLVSFWLKVGPVHHNLHLTVAGEYFAKVIAEFDKKLD